MDLGCNHLPTFCSRLIFLLEEFLRTTNERRCFLLENCQDLVQLTKCFSTNRSEYTNEVHERAQASVDKNYEDIKPEIQREKYKKLSGNSKYQNSNQHTNPRNSPLKKKSGCLTSNNSCNQDQNRKILSGAACKSTGQKKTMPHKIHEVNRAENDRSSITDAKANLKCVDASIYKNNAIQCSDWRFPCKCKCFITLEDIMKHSKPLLNMLHLFKNNNTYLINTLATTVHSKCEDNSTSVKSDSNIVGNCSPEKRFLNIVSFINSSGFNEEADPIVKLLCETQSIYLSTLEIRKSKELKLDYLLWERITSLERRFLHLLNFCGSASFNIKDDKKQRDVSYKSKIMFKSVEFWNQSCANEVQALFDKPYIQYKNRSEWENYQKTLQIIQQKKMQLQILETLISDFLPQLHNLDPNSPTIHLLLTIAFSLTSIDKHSIPLFVKV